MTNIYYVRHGQTDFNLKKIMYGKIDADLNPTGIKQAKATGLMLKDMHFDVIYCSDLKRAQQTCAQINAYHNLPVILDPRLQERGYGEIENTPEDTNGFDKRES
jgi:probable phosphoglycerate mutase